MKAQALRSRIAVAVLALPLLAGSIAATAPQVSAQTPAQILTTKYNSLGPLALPGIGIENFGVVDGRIYRGGQPAKNDYKALKAIGVKTVIDLRADFNKDSHVLAEAAGLRYL